MLIMYRPSWQRLRLSCVQDYAPAGGFKTPEGTNDILRRLSEYTQSTGQPWSIKEIKAMGWDAELEQGVRDYRVSNFLNAAINGLERTKGLEHLTQVKEAAAAMETKVDLHLVRKGNDQWNWDVVTHELRQMLIADNVWFHRIYQDMKERVVEKKKEADDMRVFIDCMREVNDMYRNDRW